MNTADGQQGIATHRVLWTVALFALVAVRTVALRADPPPWLSWSTGINTDEGYYTLDARHLALFGHWAPGDFHDRLLSPLLSLLQEGVFRLFGPTLLTARGLCVIFGLLTIGLLWLGLRRLADAETAAAATLFLGLAPPFVLYNRLALQETPTVFWLVLAFTLWACAAPNEPRRMLPTLSGAALGIAFVFKPLAFVALPAFIWLWRPRGFWPALTGLAAVLASYFLLWYLPHHAEIARMASFYRFHQMQPRGWGSVLLNVRRGLIGGERGVVPYLLALLPVPCLLTVRSLTQRNPVTLFFALWLGGGLVFCLLSSYAPSRYYVLFLPPLTALAALGWGSLRAPVRLASVIIFCLTSAAWLGDAWHGRTFEQASASQALTRTLPPGSIVIGQFAPALCLDTHFAATPVQPGLCNDVLPVKHLHATNVMVTRTPFWEDWWRMRYPALIRPSNRVLSLNLGGLRGYVVDVYSVSMQEKRPAAQNAILQANHRQERFTDGYSQ